VLALQAGEVLVFHFSGHGSQVEDLDHDEEDGLDETLVPSDARMGPTPDVSDDDLKGAFGHPERKARTHVVALLDSCHSGTGTRDGLAVRAIEPPPGTLARAQPLAPGVVRTLEIEPDHVLVSAAAAGQIALEADIDGQRRGLFTHALVTALERADPSAPLAELVNGPVQAELLRLRTRLGLRNVPNPQLEAPRASLDRPLFWPLERARPRLASASAVPDGAGFARIEGARELGLVAGALVAFYPPGELDFAAGARLGRVVALDGARARVELAGEALGAGSRAVLRLAAPALPLQLELAQEELGARTLEELAARLGARFIGNGGTAAFRALHAADGVGLVLTRADGLELARVSAANPAVAAAELADVLARAALTESLFALRHPASSLALEARLATRLALPDPTTAAREIEWRPDLAVPHLTVARADEPATLANSYHLDLRARGPCWLTILELDADGRMARLFPDASSERLGLFPGGRLADSAWQRLPDPREPRAEGVAELLRWRLGPPAGPSLLVALVTTDAGVNERLRARFPAGESLLPARALEGLAELRAELAARAEVDWALETVGAWIVE
jgi:hypothetical protein